MRLLLATLSAFFALSAPAAAWEWPVSGEVITPYRNGSDPYASGQHRGIDIAAPAGAAVAAAAAGEVRFAGTAGSSGLTVSIRTGDGYDTSYLHLSSVVVREGAWVGAGERIGSVGTTGTRSAAVPHLHFGVRDAGSRHAYHDPLSFLAPPAAPGAPEAPPAGAPERAPAPPAAAPVPLPKRAPAPIAGPGPAPIARPVPAPLVRAGPVPALTPVGGQAQSDWAQGARSPARTARPVPSPARGIRAEAVAGDQRRPTEMSVDAPAADAPGPSPLRRNPLGPASAATAKSSDGPNLGWALACAGLLLAAGVLGLTESARKSAERGRARLRGALRPQLGRR